jgi:hypothetical protein
MVAMSEGSERLLAEKLWLCVHARGWKERWAKERRRGPGGTGSRRGEARLPGCAREQLRCEGWRGKRVSRTSAHKDGKEDDERRRGEASTGGQSRGEESGAPPRIHAKEVEGVVSLSGPFNRSARPDGVRRGSNHVPASATP